MGFLTIKNGVVYCFTHIFEGTSRATWGHLASGRLHQLPRGLSRRLGFQWFSMDHRNHWKWWSLVLNVFFFENFQFQWIIIILNQRFTIECAGWEVHFSDFFSNKEVVWSSSVSGRTKRNVEVSWNRATPRYHPFYFRIFPYKPSILGCPGYFFREPPFWAMPKRPTRSATAVGSSRDCARLMMSCRKGNIEGFTKWWVYVGL